MNAELDQLAQDYWDYALSTFPTEALLLGDHRFDDQLERASRQHEDEQIGKFDGFVAAAEAISTAHLTPDEVITRAVLIEEAAHLIQARSLRSFNRHGSGIRIFGALAGSLLLRTLNRAERISQAMHCRAFEGQIRLYRDLNFKTSDFLFVVVWSSAFLFFRFVNVSHFLGTLLTGQAG